jgi:hypothetical protein
MRRPWGVYAVVSEWWTEVVPEAQESLAAKNPVLRRLTYRGAMKARRALAGRDSMVTYIVKRVDSR